MYRMGNNEKVVIPTVGSLFSGVGGIDLGFQQAGFEIVWANEIDQDSCRTYRANFSHTLFEGGIEDLKGNELEPVDVLCAGFPCQAFSVAGYRKGFEDERGNMFFEIVRLINEFETKPKVLFLENVKNFRTHDKGNTFKTVVDHLERLGYSVFDMVLNTCDYTSIPQNRERTFIICFRSDGPKWEGNKIVTTSWEWRGEDRFETMSHRFSELIPFKKSRSNRPIRAFLEKKPVAENFYYREDKDMYIELDKAMTSHDTLYQWRRHYVRENKNNRCPTLTANMGTGGHNVPLIRTDDGLRKLTPRECFNFQGFPQSFKLPKDLANSHLYKQSGNSVSVPLIQLLAKRIRQVL